MTKPKTNTRINGKDYFRIRKIIDGKPKSFYGKSKAEAKQKYSDYMKLLHEDTLVRPQMDFRASFNTEARNYITNVLANSQKYATATKVRYSMAYETHVKGTWLDRMELSIIKASDVQRFYNELNVSKQTMATVNKFMSAFNKWLVLNEYAEDFLSAVEVPSKPENKRHEGILVWEDHEVKKILSNINGHRLRFFVYILLYTGSRMSEAIALKHTDIHNGSVSIARQCYCGEMKLPKYGSQRKIPMHDKLWEAYLDHVEWQKQDMKEHQYETEFLFTTSTGRMYDPKSIRTALQRFYDAHGIPRKNPHTYRATFCTQLCRCGIPLEVASTLMGHKSIEVTSKHYAHVKDDAKQEAITNLRY